MPEGLGFFEGVYDRPLAFANNPVLDDKGKPDTMYPGHIEYVQDGDVQILTEEGEIRLTSVHFPKIN